MVNSPFPLYHQVFSILRQRILDGSYAVAEQLPTEDDLAREFKVSRATLRQAVGDLVREGMVSRKQGVGTFVLALSSHVVGQRFRGSLGDLISETRRAKIKDVEVRRGIRLPSRIAGQLHIDQLEGTIIRRTRTMDGKPFAYTVNYLPDRYGSMLDERELRKTGLMTLLEAKGVKLGSAEQIIKAQLADPHVAERLELMFGSPVLFVERVIFDTDRQPVELVVSWYRGDMYEYSVSLDLIPGEQLHPQLA